MKKKTIFLASLSAFLCLGAAYISNSSAPVHTHAEGEKETKLINITTCDGYNGNFIFNIDKEMVIADATGPFNYYLNGELKSFQYAVNNGNSAIICVPNSDHSPTADYSNYYQHYVIKAGTKIYSTASTDYVLEKDYNWWRTTNQNANDFGFIYQHGGAGDYRGLGGVDVHSLKFTTFGGGRNDGIKVFAFQPYYEETSAAWTTVDTGWQNRCPIYIDKGNGYELSANKDTSPIIWNDGKVENNNEQLLFWLFYSQVFDDYVDGSTFDNVTMTNSYYSFYIPKGTLWGGLSTASIMIEENYYFEITKDSVNNSNFHGFFTTPHDYVKHEAKEATCTSEGNVEYYTCDRVTHGGETEYFTKNADGSYTATTKEAVTLGCTAHDFVAVAEVPASDGKHGTAAHYACTTCDKVFTSADKDTEVTLESLVLHDYVKHEAKAATCEEDGNVEYYSCSACDKYFLLEDGVYKETTWDKIKLDAGHKYGEEVAEVPASEGNHGTAAHYECSVCGKYFIKDGEVYKEVTLDSLVLHDYVKHEAKAATCEEDGNVEYYTCSACDKYFLLEDGVYKETTLADITTSKTGHTYESHEVEVGTEKVTYYTCSVCNKYFLKDGENYTETTLDDINALLADAWGKYFLSTTTEPCSNPNADNKEALDAVWSTLETEFGKLSDDVKALVKKASAKASEGTKLEESVARYDHIVDRYGLKDFISRVTTDGSNYQNRVIANNNFVIVLISVLSVLALGSTVTLVFIKKRRTR